MKIKNEGRLGFNWVDELGDLIKRNNKRKRKQFYNTYVVNVIILYAMLYAMSSGM